MIKTEWTIGETYPAGGTVFYDKGEESDGWRYLSVAPSSTEFMAPYDDDWYGLFGDDCDSIETGKKNTKILADYFIQKNKQGTAALLCTEQQIGGFSDWFLPSIAELTQMYINRYEKGLGNFTEEAY